MSPSPAVMLTAHTHNSRYPHHPLGLHQSCTHHTQRPPSIRFCSPARSCYVGPPSATSNTLRNIQTDVALTSLPGPPTQMTLTPGWLWHRDEGGVCSLKRCKPLARHWKDSSRSRCVLYTWTSIFPVYSNEKSPCVLYMSAYCTQDLR